MSLPVRSLPTDTVEVDGVVIPIRSLSRLEAMDLHNNHAEDEADAEVFVLVHGADVTEDEAKAFLDGHDTETAGTLVSAIMVLSGLAAKTVQAVGPAGENPEGKS